MTRELYLCVDCGGSKTAVAIADATGAIIARATGGPSNFAYLGLANFTRTVHGSVNSALLALPTLPGADYAPLRLAAAAADSYPPPNGPFAAAWLGISGVDSPSSIAQLTPVLAALLGLPAGPRLAICNDTHLLAAPLRAHPDARAAVTAIAGTGSIAVSFARDDTAGAAGALREMARFGGWGWILGDEGGGYDVGREALRHILRAHDLASLHLPAEETQEQPALTARVLAHFGAGSPPDLLALIHDADPPHAAPAHRLLPREKRISQLAPLVFSAAFDAGDALALRVLRATAAKLADLIALLLVPQEPGGALPAPRAVRASESVLCLGGSLAGIPRYRDLVLSALAHSGHVFMRVEFVADAAAAGAAALSAQFHRTS